MSETIIKRGKPSPHLLKDATFSRASAGSKMYCYIKTTEGKYALTKREALYSANRSGRYTARFRVWLAEQDDPIWTSGMG